MTEHEHWQTITNDPDYKRQHIADPNISLEATIEAITRYMPKESKNVLEIGCGYGRITKQLKQTFPHLTITGMDISPPLVEEAQRLDPSCTFVCANTLQDLPPQDFIYSVAVFQHLQDDEKNEYIAQAFDMLRPGGALTIQFIEGSFDGFVNHLIPLEDMIDWFDDCNFRKLAINRELVHEQWTWITGVKGD